MNSDAEDGWFCGCKVLRWVVPRYMSESTPWSYRFISGTASLNHGQHRPRQDHQEASDRCHPFPSLVYQQCPLHPKSPTFAMPGAYVLPRSPSKFLLISPNHVTLTNRSVSFGRIAAALDLPSHPAPISTRHSNPQTTAGRNIFSVDWPQLDSSTRLKLIPRATARGRNPSLATAPPSLPTTMSEKTAPIPPGARATNRVEDELYVLNLEANEYSEEARHSDQAAAG